MSFGCGLTGRLCEATASRIPNHFTTLNDPSLKGCSYFIQTSLVVL